MIRPNLLALLAWMNFVELEAEERDDPDTPVESENDLPVGPLSGSQHPDDDAPNDTTSNGAPSTPTSVPTTSTPSAPAAETRTPAMLKAILLIANAVLQGAALTATTTIVAGEMLSFGISQTINYLWIRDQENRSDTFGFFGVACNNPFTGTCL